MIRFHSLSLWLDMLLDHLLWIVPPLWTLFDSSVGEQFPFVRKHFYVIDNRLIVFNSEMHESCFNVQVVTKLHSIFSSRV